MRVPPELMPPAGAEVLTFHLTSPDLVAHRSAETCRIEYPHSTLECGYFAEAATGVKT